MDESHTQGASSFIDELVNGQHEAISPIIVPLEAYAAILRQTRDGSRARRVYDLILSLPNQELVTLDFTTNELVRNVIEETALKANDAFVLAVGRELKSMLVSLDQELLNRAQGSVETKML